MRGQTTIDFAVGITLFLLAVAFVFAFSPTLVTPFTGDEGGLALSADRAATQLASDQLGNPETPDVLDDGETQNFFSNATQSSMRDALSLSQTTRINVTLTTADGSCPGNISPCRAGLPPPNSGSVASAWRVVWIANDRADLRVKVW